MSDSIQPHRPRFPWRIAGWGAVAAVLSVPLIAGWPWTPFDFVIAGVILGGAGLVVELICWASSSLSYRLGGLAALLAAVGLVWVNGAVGLFGNEENPANLMFLAVIAIAVVGAVIVRFRAAGLASVLTVAAVAQLLAGVVGYAAGWATPGVAGLYELGLSSVLFGGLWLVSAGLFHLAARAGARG